MDEEVLPVFESAIYYDDNDACFSIEVSHRGEIATFPIFVIGNHFKVIGNKYQKPELLTSK